jgi:hypothetical protein
MICFESQERDVLLEHIWNIYMHISLGDGKSGFLDFLLVENEPFLVDLSPSSPSS